MSDFDLILTMWIAGMLVGATIICAQSVLAAIRG